MIRSFKRSSMTSFAPTRNVKSGASAVSTIIGGTATTDAIYEYRAFTSSGTLEIGESSLICDVLVLAGGGGGAARGGGGGGAGGMIIESNVTLPVGTHTITVGGGGAGNASTTIGGNGVNSSIGSLFVAIGGGGGGYGSPNNVGISGASGGSGGGGGSGINAGTGGGAGTTGQGFAGGGGGGTSGGGGSRYSAGNYLGSGSPGLPVILSDWHTATGLGNATFYDGSFATGGRGTNAGGWNDLWYSTYGRGGFGTTSITNAGTGGTAGFVVIRFRKERKKA